MMTDKPSEETLPASHNNEVVDPIPSPAERFHFVSRRYMILAVILIGIPLFMVHWQSLPSIEAATVSTEESSKKEFLPEVTDQVSAVTSTHQTDSASRPSIVWLMSYPNSGTSYTMRMVASASNRAVATNYGNEYTDKDHPANMPLYPVKDGLLPQGPFWRAQDQQRLPDQFILTKTHCGGRCGRCRPSRYVLTYSQFLHACTEGKGCLPNSDSNSSSPCEWTTTHYPPPPHNPRIGKLIHLIRSPFDNFISRFHLARKLTAQRMKNDPKGLKQWMDAHPDSPAGFTRWCQELDQQYGSPFDHDNSKLPNIDHLTCLGEWFRYIQWHGMTLMLQEQNPKQLPTLTIYYEDYDRNWNETTSSILDFLKLERDETSTVREFVARKPYDDYYTQAQRKQAKVLVKKLVSDNLWQLLKQYF
ncbi:expressed unknown protein [Seminavis robusta]|uniref:Sulfotransferase domain-containing protein n=1 Tax=Seminavis robusta TaxID=568900 RepID=A0A9N8E865_9STRA|nr:expressed unknown protein [Seminavis robusta]|eukprot:Sro601_g173500.1 n/a (417) ;mRNA; f:20168-21418